MNQERYQQILVVARDPQCLEALRLWLNTQKDYQWQSCDSLSETGWQLDRNRFDAILLAAEGLEVDPAEAVNHVLRRAPRTPLVQILGQSPEQNGHRLEGAADHLPMQLLHSGDQGSAARRIIDRAIQEWNWKSAATVAALQATAAQDVLWSIDWKTKRLQVSPRLAEILGDGFVQAKLADFLDRIHPQDRSGMERNLHQVVDGHQTLWVGEFRLQKTSGEWHWFACRGALHLDGMGKADRLAGSWTDIQEKKQAPEEKPDHNRFHDAVTGLPNRNYLVDRLWRAIRRSKRRPDYRFAVLALELEGFEALQQRLNPSGLDEMFIEVARRLVSRSRAVDTVARIRDGQFALMLDDLKNPRNVLMVAERLQDELALPMEIGAEKLNLQACIGAALNTSPYPWPEDILQAATQACQTSKEAGKGLPELADRSSQYQIRARLKLEKDLRSALPANQLDIHYQPTVHLTTGRITGLEGLLRWHHPERGLLLAEDFITLADEAGLLDAMGAWSLQAACRHLRALEEKDCLPEEFRLTINLAASQFSNRRLLPRLDRLLQETAVSPHHLGFEISEEVLVDCAQQAPKVLAELKQREIAVFLDGFGKGYSSLRSLCELPIHTIKIDRAFIQNLGKNQRDTEVVRIIRNLARTLSVDLVALGIQNDQQIQQLRDLDFSFGQGLLFSEPLNFQQVLEWIDQPLTFQTPQEGSDLDPFLDSPEP
ncbi:MAG: EAL domain-containing protein [Planctomycetota bacterium]|nr:MAG: EAL domain-containing protein [Planctomycetota bacterium]